MVGAAAAASAADHMSRSSSSSSNVDCSNTVCCNGKGKCNEIAPIDIMNDEKYYRSLFFNKPSKLVCNCNEETCCRQTLGEWSMKILCCLPVTAWMCIGAACYIPCSCACCAAQCAADITGDCCPPKNTHASERTALAASSTDPQAMEVQTYPSGQINAGQHVQPPSTPVARRI